VGNKEESVQGAGDEGSATSAHHPDMLTSIRQESNLPGTLDGNRHTALVPGAQATLPTGVNLPAIADKATQLIVSLPINDFILISAEDTNLSPGLKTPSSGSAPALLLLLLAV
jgi:hypothetical protein